MNLIETSSWEDFQEKLHDVQHEEDAKEHSSQFLFRGTGDSAWVLETTLERAGRDGERISDYYNLIIALKSQVETYSMHRWEIAESPEIEKAADKIEAWSSHKFPTPEIYSYMVYLRHHGFPSPLLDWSRSPYVAAFFAFRSVVRPRDDKVSIFAFSEMPEWSHVYGSFSPWIRRIGHHVRAHRRHFLQQSDYTMCEIFEHGPGRFANHESVFSRNNKKQDVLWKFNIPWGERTKVLTQLDAYNLNAYSLFESEESLMETLAFRTLQAGRLS